jgi:Flp pilus assembly protein TadB
VLRRLDTLLEQADLDWTSGQLLGASAALGVVPGLVTALLVGWPVVGVFVGGLLGAFPLVYAVWRRAERVARRQEALIGALERIRSELGSVTLQEALLNARSTVPPVLVPVFEQIAQDLQQRRSLAEALRRSRVRLPDRAWETCVAAFLLSEALGGEALSATLGRLIASLRADVQWRGALAAQQARQITSARITLVLPILVVVFLRTSLPGADAFYSGPVGELLLLVCGLCMVFGYWLMLRTGRLSEAPRGSRQA